MKVLGIVCSPRKAGNTQIMMEEALAAAKDSGAEVEMWTVAGKDLKPCDGCEKCLTSGQCRIDDDMQPLYAKIEEADGIIFGTPTYYWNVTAQAKMVIDRMHAMSRPKRRLRDKSGAVLITQTRGGASGCYQTFSSFFNLQRMVTCGAAIAFGTARGEVKKDERGLAEARAVARVVVRSISRLQHIDRNAPIEQPMTMPSRRMDNTPSKT